MFVVGTSYTAMFLSFCFFLTRTTTAVSTLQVDEVRSADDALMRVKLMMFYELTDIEKMVHVQCIVLSRTLQEMLSGRHTDSAVFLSH